jgi:hypothetical protein
MPAPAAVKRQPGRVALWAGAAVCFAVPFVCATNLTINRFYTFGAEVLDSGWFAWLVTEARQWGMPSPPAIGGGFDHVAPMFFLWTALHDLVPFIPAPVWLALILGFWFGLLGLACALCLLPGLTRLPGRLESLPQVAAVLALLAAGNGIALAIVGFPHVEIAIPALLFLTIALRGGHRLRWLWPLPFVLLLTVREDAGLHAALAFAALAALRGWQQRNWRAAVPETGLMLAGLLAGGAALLLQHSRLAGGDNLLASEYLGTPLLAHLTPDFLAHRVHLLFRDRSYIWAPLLLLGLQAAFWRDLRLLVGLLICLPWFTLSFVAIGEQPGEMWSYYSFPLMVGLCWPALAGRAFNVPPRDCRRYAVAQAALAVLSIGLFVGSGNNHDRHPWRGFGPGGWARIAPTEQAVDSLLARRPMLGHLIVDDRVAALRPGAFSADELHLGLTYTPAEIARADTMVDWPGGWLAHRKAALRAAAGLTHATRLPGTKILLYTRPPPPVSIAFAE